MTPVQKCPHCHTPLPDFRPLESKICPNCNRRVKYDQPDDGTTTGKVLRWIRKNPFVFWPFLFYIAFSLITGEFDDSIVGYGIMILISLWAYGSARAKALRQERDTFPKEKRSAGPALNFMLLFIFGMLTLLGLLFTIGGIRAQQELEDGKGRFVTLDAEIVAIEQVDDDHDVYVSYRYDGVDYEDVLLSYYDSSMDAGDIISVTIDPEDPETVISDSPVTIIVGSVFLVLGLIGLWFSVLRPIRRARSKQKAYL